MLEHLGILNKEELLAVINKFPDNSYFSYAFESKANNFISVIDPPFKPSPIYENTCKGYLIVYVYSQPIEIVMLKKDILEFLNSIFPDNSYFETEMTEESVAIVGFNIAINRHVIASSFIYKKGNMLC